MSEPARDAVCPVRTLTEEQRQQRAHDTGGEPILEFTGPKNPYVDYVGTDVLLSLQRTRTDAPGEPAFLIATQIIELMFKLGATEARRARDLVEAGEVDEALWVLRRMREITDTLVSCWGMLRTLSPSDYALFRDDLGEGSGFQSSMYRQLEFALGNKNASMLRPHKGQFAYDDALRALHEPSLYDAAVRLLHRSGLDVPMECVERDWSEQREENDAVVKAWRAVYAEPDRYHGLYRLAEALVDVAYDLGRWRFTHLLVVERVIGGKVGTGGTNGVRWLRKVADHRFFPELWTVRSLV
jgi:tryptophan 2,3-dioxygenase